MHLPEFTAEASLGKVNNVYGLTPEVTGGTGSVLPQGFHVTPAGDLIFCDPDAGCWKIGHTRANTHV